VTAVAGLTGMIGSLCWFMAFTLQNAAYVKALGQVELVFSFFAATGIFVFREAVSGREVCGAAFVVLSILVLWLRCSGWSTPVARGC